MIIKMHTALYHLLELPHYLFAAPNRCKAIKMPDSNPAKMVFVNNKVDPVFRKDSAVSKLLIMQLHKYAVDVFSVCSPLVTAVNLVIYYFII